MSKPLNKPLIRHNQMMIPTSPTVFSNKKTDMQGEDIRQEGDDTRITDQLEDISKQQTEKIEALSPSIFQDRQQLFTTATKSTTIIPPTSSRHPVTGKQTIRIPASHKRSQKIEPRKKSSPFVHIGVIISILVLFSLSALFVNPVNSNSQISTIKEAINGFFQGDDNNTINIVQRQTDPTATPASQTTEGYCGGYDIWGTCAQVSTASGTQGTGSMQHPINGAIITQIFANPEYQFWCGCVKPHSGIDLAATYGTPIQAADSGEVIWVGWDWSGLGNAVKISHGNYIATIYGHLARYTVKVGQIVSKGQTIAYEGSTGASTGPHLHFMVMINNTWVNPAIYMTLP